MTSPVCIGRKTKEEALETAQAIASGNHDIQLRKLETVGSKKPAPTVEPHAREGGEVVPPPPVAPVVIPADNYNVSLSRAIRAKVSPEEISAKLEAMLKATKPIYSGGVKVADAPDWSAIQFALTFSANYTVGRPLERTEILERKEIGEGDLIERINDSEFYRQHLATLLARAEEAARRAGEKDITPKP